MRSPREIAEFLAAQLNEQGFPTTVIGRTATGECDCPSRRKGMAPGMAPEPELEHGETTQPCETPGQLIDLADLANALRPGRKITIAIEAIAYDEGAGE